MADNVAAWDRIRLRPHVLARRQCRRHQPRPSSERRSPRRSSWRRLRRTSSCTPRVKRRPRPGTTPPAASSSSRPARRCPCARSPPRSTGAPWWLQVYVVTDRSLHRRHRAGRRRPRLHGPRPHRRHTGHRPPTPRRTERVQLRRSPRHVARSRSGPGHHHRTKSAGWPRPPASPSSSRACCATTTPGTCVCRGRSRHRRVESWWPTTRRRRRHRRRLARDRRGRRVPKSRSTSTVAFAGAPTSCGPLPSAPEP